MRKPVVLRNVAFPVFMLLLLPPVWLVILPLNLLVDLAVLLVGYQLLIERVGTRGAMRALGWKTAVVTWLFGFLADFAGGGLLLGATMANELFPALRQESWNAIQSAIIYNPFRNLWALSIVLLAVALVGVLIYLFARYIGLRRIGDLAARRKLALALAVCTAPYLFLLPTEWLYSLP